MREFALGFLLTVFVASVILLLTGCATTHKITAAMTVEEQILQALAHNQAYERLKQASPDLAAYIEENREGLRVGLTRGVLQYVALRYDGMEHRLALERAVHLGSAYCRLFYGLDVHLAYHELVYAPNPDMPPSLVDALDRLVGGIVIPELTA